MAFIRIATGFVATKFVAIYAGTSGIALLGAFSNIIGIAGTFANGAMNNGVIKYTAQYELNIPKQKNLFSTAFKISFYSSLLTGFVFFFFSSVIAKYFFNATVFVLPLKLFSCTAFLFAANSLLIAIINGKQQIKKLSLINTLGSVLGALLTILLAYFYGLQGALYALVISQTFVLFVTLLYIRKCDWFAFSYFNQKFNFEIFKKLSHFSLMAVVTIVTVPLSQIIIRNMIINTLNVQSAGIWQGMMRISEGYLLVFTTAFATYYLPKLSSLRTDKDLKAEVLQGYKIILPAVGLCCFIIYMFRYVIIELVYTPEFIIMSELFFYQLIGDFFKIIAYVLGYMIVAKAMTKHFLITELGFSITYISLSFYFVSIKGIVGISMAYAITYFIYFVAMIIIFKKLLFKKSIASQ